MVGSAFRKGCIKTHPSSYLAVLPSYVARAPVKTESRIQSTIRSRIRAENGLACHAINQIVAAAQASCRIRKLASVVRATEFVDTGIRFAAHRSRRLYTISVRRMNQVASFK